MRKIFSSLAPSCGYRAYYIINGPLNGVGTPRYSRRPRADFYHPFLRHTGKNEKQEWEYRSGLSFSFVLLALKIVWLMVNEVTGTWWKVLKFKLGNFFRCPAGRLTNPAHYASLGSGDPRHAMINSPSSISDPNDMGTIVGTNFDLVEPRYRSSVIGELGRGKAYVWFRVWFGRMFAIGIVECSTRCHNTVCSVMLRSCQMNWLVQLIKRRE